MALRTLNEKKEQNEKRKKEGVKKGKKGKKGKKEKGKPSIRIDAKFPAMKKKALLDDRMPIDKRRQIASVNGGVRLRLRGTWREGGQVVGCQASM